MTDNTSHIEVTTGAPTYGGIATGADLVSVRVLNRQGVGTVSSVIAGINWVIKNRSTYNIRVMNLSLGTAVTQSYKTDPLCQAVARAVDAGITTVVASGLDPHALTRPSSNSTTLIYSAE